MNSKNILIISYVFPPYPGIGGRRWAKFAKYLHRAGHNIFVIAAKNPFNHVSTFMKDIEELPKENLYYLPAKYPTILLKQPKTFFEKLQYHFWIRILPFFTKGNFYDRTMFWKNQLQNTIRKIVKEKKINTIIVSGPDFGYVYYTLLLKKEFPKIQFIVDYRDEWTFNDVHGFGIISQKRKNVEIEKEKFVCKTSDIIISPHIPILNYIKATHKMYIKFSVITQAFDTDDFDNKNANINNAVQKKIISYFGTLQPQTKTFFIELSKMLDYLKDNNLPLYQILEFHFYLINDFPYLSVIKNHKHKFKFSYHIPNHIIFDALRQSCFILIISSHRAKDYFTTKFPEIFYLKKPILLYSEKGAVSEFIEKHHIGVHLPKENFTETFMNAIENINQYNYDNFPIDEWDYRYVTQKLLQLIYEK